MHAHMFNTLDTLHACLHSQEKVLIATHGLGLPTTQRAKTPLSKTTFEKKSSVMGRSIYRPGMGEAVSTHDELRGVEKLTRLIYSFMVGPAHCAGQVHD